MTDEEILFSLDDSGYTRRDFLKICGALSSVIGLKMPDGDYQKEDPRHVNNHSVQDISHSLTQILENKVRLPVIWLAFQDCAGCTEALTRSHAPTLTNLLLHDITLEYHETLSSAAGSSAEASRHEAMQRYKDKYILIVEGSIPSDATSFYCAIGGRAAKDILEETAAGAAAVIAIGNCAAYGGIARAKPNPTGARSVQESLPGKKIVNISGCPAIPEVLTGIVAHYLLFSNLPDLDSLGRPKIFYNQIIHDRCPRRGYYEAGKFALSFSDEGAKQGWCLYKLGCKGPTTYNACATMKWDGGTSFPIQANHPCLGCSEPGFWDGGGFYQGQSAPIDRPTLTMVGAAAAAGISLGAGMAYANRIKNINIHED